MLATFTVYSQVRHFDFVNLDDNKFTTDNVHVQQGLTTDSLRWALTARDAVNWFPLVWVSHMVDYQLFGADSGWHHLHNVLLHTLATILLCLFLQRATGARWRSALAALFFALHPLHVQSVAWVAERKDVLSACFWFLTLWLYVWYSERRGIGRYLTVALCFCLGLMAKPMLVTLPLVLLLLDYWPLARLRLSWHKAILEKLPLLLPSAADAAITYLVQSHAHALAVVPLPLRLQNAVHSCAIYILQTFWPLRLAVIYPYPRALAFFPVLAAGLLLVSITAAVLLLRRRAPYLFAGWGWFLITLIPVIGLVQSGYLAHQDHYMYLPMVGLLVMLVWGVADLLERMHLTVLAVPLAATACLACAVLSWIQIGYWRNSETLFQHALAVTDDNSMANDNLGLYLLDAGRTSEAISHLQAAARIDPNNFNAHNDLGVGLARTGHLPEAIAQFQAAIHIAPDATMPHNNLGTALLNTGDINGAIAEFESTLRLDPANDDARQNLARAQNILSASGQSGGLDDPHFNRGVALMNAGNFSGAITEFEACLLTHPNEAGVHNALGVVMVQAGRLPDAIDQFSTVVKLKPDSAVAQYNLGGALASVPGRIPEALQHLEEAERLRPAPQLEQMIAHLRAEQQ